MIKCSGCCYNSNDGRSCPPDTNHHFIIFRIFLHKFQPHWIIKRLHYRHDLSELIKLCCLGACVGSLGKKRTRTINYHLGCLWSSLFCSLDLKLEKKLSRLCHSPVWESTMARGEWSDRQQERRAISSQSRLFTLLQQILVMCVFLVGRQQISCQTTRNDKCAEKRRQKVCFSIRFFHWPGEKGALSCLSTSRSAARQLTLLFVLWPVDSASNSICPGPFSALLLSAYVLLTSKCRFVPT